MHLCCLCYGVTEMEWQLLLNNPSISGLCIIARWGCFKKSDFLNKTVHKLIPKGICGISKNTKSVNTVLKQTVWPETRRLCLYFINHTHRCSSVRWGLKQSQVCRYTWSCRPRWCTCRWDTCWWWHTRRGLEGDKRGIQVRFIKVRVHLKFGEVSVLAPYQCSSFRQEWAQSRHCRCTESFPLCWHSGRCDTSLHSQCTHQYLKRGGRGKMDEA